MVHSGFPFYQSQFKLPEVELDFIWTMTKYTNPQDKIAILCNNLPNVVMQNQANVTLSWAKQTFFLN